MKLHFESDLPYQAAAIEAVCDLFKGQEVCRSEFTVTMRAANSAVQGSLEGMQGACPNFCVNGFQVKAE